MAEEQLAHSSARWGTLRHKIAASLLVYGYQLCSEQPFLILRDPDEKHPDGISVWFTPTHPSPDVVPETCPEWESLWIKPEKWKPFKAANPGHPWVFMRAGLDARDWLIQKAIRGGECKGQAPRDAFRTEDLDFAACLIALSWHLYDYSTGVFTFKAGAANLKRAYDNDGDVKHVIRWSKWALKQSNILQNRIKDARNIPQLGFRHGDRAAVFPVTAPPSIAEPLVRALLA